MARGGKPEQYADDMFADTRMSFGDHIEDLRTHLLRAIYGFLLMLLASFAIGHIVLGFIARPVEIALGEYWKHYYEQRIEEVDKGLKDGDSTLLAYNKPLEVQLSLVRSDLLAAVGKAPADPSGPEYVKIKGKLDNPLAFFGPAKLFEPYIGRKPTLSTLRVEEAFMVWFKVCLVTGFVLASPWIFYQLWSFVAAGLYPHEKRYVNVFMPFSLGLFLAGVVLCEWFVLPKAVEALLWFNEWLGLEPELRLNEWLGFAILMPLIFGLTFQTPLVMLFVERIGLFSIDTMRKKRKYAWFIMAVFAAIVTPSPDALSMLLLWVPMSMLYELGILLCWLRPPPAFEDEDSDTGALVEV
jgi:sec-independent protein translocase protein TatC